MSTFPHLFSPIRLGATELGNRIVSTAHHTHLASEVPTPALAAYHEARARGGVGLIVLEASSVHPSGWFAGHLIETHEPASIPGYRAIAEACHRHGTRVFGQLFHPGREVRGRPGGLATVTYAPSSVPGERHHVVPREMSRSLIAEVVTGFGHAAANLRAAGLDGVEILASHGYLPAQFLSPTVNRRDDPYGGSLDRRLRFLREVIEAVRAQAGDLTLGLRVSADSHAADGVPPEEMITACRTLEAEGGLDYFSLVVGSAATRGAATHVVPPMCYEHAYVVKATRELRRALGLPVMIAGRINQPQTAEQIIADGDADLCGLCRALICDPELPVKAQSGRLEDIRACIACNQACAGHGQLGAPISCIQYPESGRELAYPSRERPARSCRVLVAGAGPAGLKTAAVAAARGHDVTLYEAEARVGGQVQLAAELPGRQEFATLVANLSRECELAGVTILTGTCLDEAEVLRQEADAIVIATGAEASRWPAIENHGAHIVSYEEVLRGTARVGQSVVVADWRCDWVGAGVAERLAANGCRVRLGVAGLAPAEHLMPYVRDTTNAALHAAGVEVLSYVRLFGADEDTAYFQHIVSDAPIVVEQVDTVVVVGPSRPRVALEQTLAKLSLQTYLAGDCLAPRTAEEAVFEGLQVGSRL